MALGIKKEIYSLENVQKSLLKAADESMYIEIENGKSKVVFHGPLTQKGIQRIQDIEAGEYTARIIRDSNRNNRWDQVSYQENIQPEDIWVYPGKINVRANWEIKLKWPLEN